MARGAGLRREVGKGMAIGVGDTGAEKKGQYSSSVSSSSSLGGVSEGRGRSSCSSSESSHEEQEESLSESSVSSESEVVAAIFWPVNSGSRGKGAEASPPFGCGMGDASAVMSRSSSSSSELGSAGMPIC